MFNELALQRCDLLLAEAAKNNIRLILALSNWWDEQARALAPVMRQSLARCRNPFPNRERCDSCAITLLKISAYLLSEDCMHVHGECTCCS